MSDSLIEDEFINRPEDDELAFLHYEKIFRNKLDQHLENLADSDSGRYQNSYNHFVQTYLNNVLSAVSALEVDVLRMWVNNPNDATNPEYFQRVQYDIDSAVVLIKVRHALASRKASIKLDADTRSKIRDYISKIKTTIESIELPISRKEALLKRLNEFSAEVDRDRTKFEAIGALVVEAATITGKAEAKLRPIRKWLDSITGLMRAASGLEEPHGRLSAPPKRIPGPTKEPASTSPKQEFPSLDDDIPF